MLPYRRHSIHDKELPGRKIREWLSLTNQLTPSPDVA
jgi:hypothetical protein